MRRQRKLIKRILVIACGLSLLFSIPTFAENGLYGRVTNLQGDVLNVRIAAGVDSQWLGVLRENDDVSITGSQEDAEGTVWYEIKYNDGTAYVSSDYVTVSDENEESAHKESAESPESSDSAELIEPLVMQGTIFNLQGDILNIRSGPGTSNSRLGSFTEGASVNITGLTYDENGSPWYRIDYNGNPAFVHGDYVNTGTEALATENLETAVEPVQLIGTVINIGSDVLNIRSGAGTHNDIIGTFRENERISITGEASDRNNTKWYSVDYNGSTGYIHSYYVSIGEISEPTPEDSGESPDTTEENGQGSSVGDTIVQIATAYANDDSHGYRNVSGDNAGYGATGSFDCGGLVSRVLWDMGIFPKNKFYEPNSGLEWALTNYGFEAIGYNYDILQPGDVLYRYGHTVIYAGNGKVVGAHGYMGNYDAGDQNGDEVSLTDFYGNWEYIFRYVGE